VKLSFFDKEKSMSTANVTMIRLPVRFDFSTHKVFTQQCETALASPECQGIEVDFSLVQYLDSSALGMLVLLHRKASALKLTVVLKGCQGTALDILTMANMNKLFQVC
jgi:HptB-dependent secretion and biofilm anti anti-sigma factor